MCNQYIQVEKKKLFDFGVKINNIQKIKNIHGMVHNFSRTFVKASVVEMKNTASFTPNGNSVGST